MQKNMKKYFNKIIIFSIIIIAIISGGFLIDNFLQAQGQTTLPDFDVKITKPGLPNADLLKYFFFKKTGEKDIIGVRVYKNPQHISPLQWYKENVPNSGNPPLIKVDGYEALQDGRSIYVSVGYIDKDKFELKTPNTPLQSYLTTYIYLISYNEGANSETIEIFNRMLKEWKFNVNVIITSEQKQQVRNDIKRWADVNNIKILLENYKITHGYYPKLTAGSYIQNHTVSVWPSWQYELGKELGSFLPIDPINRFGPCPEYDLLTCWNKETKKYAGEIRNRILYPVLNSFVFTYSSILDGQDYYLGYETEFGKGCNNISQCFVNDSCVEIGTCYPPDPPGNKIYCRLGDWVNSCGNEIIKCGEQCDTNSRNFCDTMYGEHQWNKEKIQECLNCDWEAVEYIKEDCGGYCGDEILQTDYEQCENNFITPTPVQAIDENHQYECLNCKLFGGWCGDKILQTNYNEQCDDGNKIDTDHCNNICANQNQNPVVNLEESKTIRNGSLVEINGSASDADNDQLIYLWEIVSAPENSVAVLSSNNTLNTSFTPDKVGEYKLKLTAKDNYNGQGFDEINIISQTYCGDNEIQEAGPYHEGATEECDQQNGLENWQCVGAGVPQCNVNCKIICTDDGTPAQCGIGAAKLYGEISNIMSSDKISGVLIEIKDSKDKLIVATTSDVDGKYSFENLAKSFSLTETLCGYKMTVSATGFQIGSLDLFAFDQDLEKNFVLTPEGLKLGTKIILKWGATPLDLDAHLNFEADDEFIDINYGNQGPYQGASLDQEDTDGNGPEIIIIDFFVEGSIYQYYVHNYSGTTEFSSAPIVQIVDAHSNVLYEFSPTTPLTDFQEYWHVFDIDGSTGNITKQNVIQNDTP